MIDAILIKGEKGGFDLFGVFDGHNGDEVSKFASKQFETLLKEQLEVNDPIAALKVCLFFLTMCLRMIFACYFSFNKKNLI